MSEHTSDESPVTEAAVLDAGARRLYGKSWAGLLGDFARIGRTPSADFTAAMMVAGALALLKKPAA